MPFLLHLADSGLSKRTIQNHVDNMWVLGRRNHPRRERGPLSEKGRRKKLVRNVIHQDGGPR